MSKTNHGLKQKRRKQLLDRANKELSEEQRNKIMTAIFELKSGDVEMILEDFTGLYFMALDHELMDFKPTRDAKTTTFLCLHNFISHLEAILNKKEGYYSLSI